jgi:diaminopimelate epimerase
MPKTIPFSKYHGAGNDFIMIDHRVSAHLDHSDLELIRLLCDRHFGIGADGLILLENCPGADFEMKYFNADGRPGSMCGNGGRCAVAFAHSLGIEKTRYRFLAPDGYHEAVFAENAWVELSMAPVGNIETGPDFYFLNTGSPHYVRFVEDISQIDIVAEGRAIRYNERFRVEGTNVNFAAMKGGGIEVATYERGVEDETLSCGTGVTASALAAFLKNGGGEERIPVQTKGGALEVRFRETESGFDQVWLCGPARFVFKGECNL